MGIVIGILVAVGAVALLVVALYLGGRKLQRVEPYATVLRLRSRQQLRFFRSAATDPRVPKRVKVMPLLLAIYLLTPIDLVPDFIPVLGYVDDVGVIVAALALMVRMTPVEVVLSLAEDAGGRG